MGTNDQNTGDSNSVQWVGSAQGTDKPHTQLWSGLFWEANEEASKFPKYSVHGIKPNKYWNKIIQKTKPNVVTSQLSTTELQM